MLRWPKGTKTEEGYKSPSLAKKEKKRERGRERETFTMAHKLTSSQEKYVLPEDNNKGHSIHQKHHNGSVKHTQSMVTSIKCPFRGQRT